MHHDSCAFRGEFIKVDKLLKEAVYLCVFATVLVMDIMVCDIM